MITACGQDSKRATRPARNVTKTLLSIKPVAAKHERTVLVPTFSQITWLTLLRSTKTIR